MGESRTDDRVTVSLPFFGCRQTLRRAVESILAQTHERLELVVVNDGDRPPWDLLEDLEDPRLVRFDLESNHGRYFADAVVLAATDDAFFAVQDADDWSEPHRLATLLELLRSEDAAGAVSAGRCHHAGRDAAHVERARHLAAPLTPELRHLVNHHGLFRVQALRAIGGCYGGFRIGYDTLLVNFLLMTGRLAYTEEVLYHRQIRAESLANSAATGIGSPARRAVLTRLRRLYADAYRRYRLQRQGKLEAAALAAEISRLRRRHVTDEDEATLAGEAARLRRLLTRPGAEAHPTPIDDPRLPWDRLPWDAWAISRLAAGHLLRQLEETRPERILEAGSGTSTVLLADYAARRGATVVSLEHDARHHRRTRRLLERMGLAGHVDLRLAPLRSLLCADGASHPWYDAELTGRFDFVLVDGPPERQGRQAALFAVAPLLADSWRLWLHDASRAHERACVDLWERHFRFAERLAGGGPRGFLELRGPRAGRPRDSGARDAGTQAAEPVPGPAGADLGISILTGGRPALLERTIETLRRENPGLLEDSFVVALINGDDPRSARYLEGLGLVDRVLRNGSKVWSIGEATSRLMRTLAGQERVKYVLHLEDDWAADGDDPGWLERARRILDRRPEVGQVRLRQASERVLPYHMVTRRPIHWRDLGADLEAAAAHYTFNPSLIRAGDVSRIFPCADEHAAQVRFLAAGLATAQLVPGVFRHIGEHDSRRRRRAKRAPAATYRPPRRPPVAPVLRAKRAPAVAHQATVAEPLVSCIMPTRDRRAYVPRAIHYFLRQDYPKRELLVVDDSVDGVGDLIPDDPRIRYLRLEEKTSVGAKRNLACEAARGEVIVHWDDDDWMAGRRIRYQVEQLLAAGADLCGVPRLYFYHVAAGHAWSYACPRPERTWLAGGTFCYRRQTWRGRPFVDRDVGEDTQFLWTEGRGQLLPLSDPSIYVAMIHGANTNAYKIGGKGWVRVADGVLPRLMEEDWSFYRDLRESPKRSRASVRA